LTANNLDAKQTGRTHVLNPIQTSQLDRMKNSASGTASTWTTESFASD